jgi:chromosome segregation protein
MQLTKLEIKGFKSFGDKAVIHFDEGITGIVGPNGCGKSNVVDAIRWVLGEQKTKALRSEKMENVIFNGTRTRKPTQLAEVSLTFNNTKNLLPTEYSQLTITRRFYRSGESEYLLNGITCRLKDITNLFLDTGIASNSYAIIELKMVDDILNDKDNSRRGLFEEAAGISKFKIRKRETLKKLDETDEDLQRVEDLLFEINKNLKSLEKQARQAEKYFQLKDDYQNLSIVVGKISLAKHQKVYNEIQDQLSKENDNKLMLQTRILNFEAELEHYKKQLLDKEKLLSERQKKLNEQVNNIRQLESEKRIRIERLHFIQEKTNTLSNQVDQDLNKKKLLIQDIEGLMNQEISAQKILQEAEMLLLSLKEDFDKQKGKTETIQKEVHNFNNEYREKQHIVFQRQKSFEIKEVQLSSLKQDLEKIMHDASVQSASIQDLEKKIKVKDAERAQKIDELKELNDKEKEFQNQILFIQESMEINKEELSIINRKLDAKNNEYNLTKSLADNLDGFPEAIKFLKISAHWVKDAPLLSDIITCEDRYKITIENYLDHYMNYFIVDVEAQAFEAVNILKEASKGKASFFILNSFKDFIPSPTVHFSNSIAAIDIVEYEEKYAPLISYILNGVYIISSNTEDIPGENHILITENGTITKKLHTISGGSIGLFEGKRLGRAKNLEKLKNTINELRKNHDEKIHKIRIQQEALASLKATTAKNEIEQLKKTIESLNSNFITFKTKLEQVSGQLHHYEDKKVDILKKISSFSEELMILKPNLEKEVTTLKETEEKIKEYNTALIHSNSLLSQFSTGYNQQNIELYQAKNNLNRVLQELEFKKNAVKGADERIVNNKIDLKKNEVEISRLSQLGKTTEEDLLKLYIDKDEIEEELNKSEKDYFSLRGNIDQLEKEVKEIQRSREHTDTLLINLNNNLNEVKLEINSIKERLFVEFSIDGNLLQIQSDNPCGDVTHNETALKERIISTKAKIEKLGPVNPMAMEAYEEIKERNDFITSQKDDLLKAKESLMATISEIDTVAKETFLKAYAKIKENFILVFRSLFTEEDDCDLKLSDPNNPLESSIEIMAKPKGKKPLTINQLSGGEKTLTAISLLFAIYLLKPAPFCILDEVDAPLDDANIDKFNHIIKKFSTDSQFIIVTHNKRTMSSTDIIYGITMIEQGISRLVPVDLRTLV